MAQCFLWSEFTSVLPTLTYWFNGSFFPLPLTQVTRKVASRSPQVTTEASVKSQQIRGSKPLKTQPASSDGKPVVISVTRPAAMPTRYSVHLHVT